MYMSLILKYLIHNREKEYKRAPKKTPQTSAPSNQKSHHTLQHQMVTGCCSNLK